MSYVIILNISIILIILILSIILFVKLYLKIKSSDKNSINLIEFPKDTDQKIKDFINESNNFKSELQKFLYEEHQSAKKIISDIDDKISPFEKVAKEKSEELKAYKQGFEYVRYKALIDGIIDTIQFIESSKAKINSNDEILNSYLESFKDKLLIILNNSGVETFSPTLNTSALENQGCEIDLVTESTDDKKKENLIFSVMRKGYRIELKKDNFLYVKKALVKVYEHKEKLND